MKDNKMKLRKLSTGDKFIAQEGGDVLVLKSRRGAGETGCYSAYRFGGSPDEVVSVSRDLRVVPVR